MAWVLFALGILLAWLVWWRRQMGDGGLVTTDGMTFSDDRPFEPALAPQTTDSSAETELESANIVLIGERDKAVLELESLQEEVQMMQARLVELEADNTAQVSQSLPEVQMPPSVVVDNKDTEELQRVQAELDSLNNTLSNERKARRATELELLNSKNRHEKFVANNPAGISEAHHQREINYRDEQIEKLKLQLEECTAAPVVESEIRSTDGSFEEALAEHATVEEAPVKQTMSARENIAEDFETKPVANKTAAKNGYVPGGWSVPEETPTETDKLTRIKGVGPVLEKMLHDCGIYFYHQVADLDEKGVEELQLQIPQFPGRIQRDRWVEQATKLQKKKEVVEERE